jgi:thioredoxin-like negative regulator of GroEL
LVDADTETFADETSASVPVVVDIPLLAVIRDGHEVDRIVGALPRAALEQRLSPVLAS